MYAVSDQSIITMAETLVKEFFCHFEVPEELHSNQGRNLNPSPLHQTLATQLVMVMDKQQRDGDKQLLVRLVVHCDHCTDSLAPPTTLVLSETVSARPQWTSPGHCGAFLRVCLGLNGCRRLLVIKS